MASTLVVVVHCEILLLYHFTSVDSCKVGWGISPWGTDRFWWHTPDRLMKFVQWNTI